MAGRVIEAAARRGDVRPPTVHRQLYTRDGVQIAVRDRGSSDVDPTIVLLHGLCLSSHSWSRPARRLSAALGDAVRIISYDHRGHGRSARAPMSTYHVDQLADDLADVLGGLGVQAPLTLAGHSLGGMTALTYCARPARLQPVQPQGLVLVATAAGQLAQRGMGRLLATPAPALSAALVAHAPATAAERAVRALARPACELLARCGRCGSAEREPLCTLCCGAVVDGVKHGSGVLPHLRRYDQTGVPSMVRACTTVVSGGTDLLTPAGHAQQLAAGIAGAAHRNYPRAGHMLLDEAPREIANAIVATAQVRARYAEAASA